MHHIKLKENSFLRNLNVEYNFILVYTDSGVTGHEKN